MILDEECIRYLDAHSGGATVAHREQKIVLESGNFVEIALNDLKMALKNVSSLNIFNKTEERDDMMVTSFLGYLESEKCIYVKQIHFEVFSFGGRLNCGGFSLDPGACTQRFRSPRW